MSTVLENTPKFLVIAKIPVLQEKISPLYPAGNQGNFRHGFWSIKGQILNRIDGYRV